MRIVVVEDEKPIREGMSRILAKIDKDYELVGTAVNGIEGLKLIEKESPELVIMDIHMPDMDGLTMLAKVREQGIRCRAIVLTAHSDFMYAKMAIELGIENYLLKPIKIQELKHALKQVEKDLMEEQSKEQLLSLEHIFYRSVNSQFVSDKQTDETLQNYYHIKPDEEFVIFFAELGDGYHIYHDTVLSLLEDINVHNNTFSACLMKFEEKSTVIMLLYWIKDRDELYQYFQKSVTPMLYGQIKGRLICAWKACWGLNEVNPAVRQIREELGWNLTFHRGTLISSRRIAMADVAPLKYPIEIETQAKQAIVHNNEQEFRACTLRLQDYCRQCIHDPKEIKEACVRYGMTVFHTAKESGKMTGDVSTQDIMNRITQAIDWEELAKAFFQFFESLCFQKEEEHTSLMVQRANQLIQEYYNQGITLDEIARRLCVSEEYLSAQFKKETGKTFSGTIRGYRIEKVKELLLKSNLKLNQIANMAGYSDPKYMSKVFKDEVGISPAEYRKLNN